MFHGIKLPNKQTNYVYCIYTIIAVYGRIMSCARALSYIKFDLEPSFEDPKL